MLAGIREILIISTPHDTGRLAQLLGDGQRWGLNLSYAQQPSPDGIAQALLIAETFLQGSPSALILGDNIFYGNDLPTYLRRAGLRTSGATVFTYPVKDPRRYGVVEFDADGRILSLEEKPDHPRSYHALTGLYFYDEDVVEHARALRPSPRGELEITDLNNRYRAGDRLYVISLGRGHAWMDAGTHDALLEASGFVRTLEDRHGLKISCPEEIAWRMGYISSADLHALAEPLRASGYGRYLLRLLKEEAAQP